MPNLIPFYEATTGLSFALLGFWWLVIELRHREFVTDPTLRRSAYQMSLYFALPGMMSLVSLLATDNPLLWRVGFVAAGLVGLLQAPVAMRALRWTGSGRILAGQWALTVLYALLVLVAFSPTLPERLGLGLTGLETEGLLVALFIFLGINVAWAHFMHSPNQPEPGDADLPRGRF
jgi:hypothetical protein